MNEQNVIIELGQWKVYLLQTETGNLLICPYKPSPNEIQCLDILVKPNLDISVNGIKANASRN